MSPVPKIIDEKSENSLPSGADLDSLMSLVYAELHRQAHRFLRHERQNHTLQTTALINEVYLRLVDQNNVRWQSKAHFFGIAANMMRRILVDYAKTKHRAKRGGINQDLPLDSALTVIDEKTDEKTRIDLILLDEALNKLASLDDRQAKIVELRYFSGLTVEETAQILSISEKTVIRDWKMAKAWLHREITFKYS